MLILIALFSKFIEWIIGSSSTLLYQSFGPVDIKKNGSIYYEAVFY